MLLSFRLSRRPFPHPQAKVEYTECFWASWRSGEKEQFCGFAPGSFHGHKGRQFRWLRSCKGHNVSGLLPEMFDTRLRVS